VLWRADVISECCRFLDEEIDGPSPRVTSFDYAGAGSVGVEFGRHSYANVDLKTGKVAFWGSD
jgi:hypothetical protein